MSATPWSKRSLGIDAARWQGTLRIQQIRAAGIEFCLLKATDGLGRDPAFAANWLALRGVMDRGAYHWFQPDIDPVAQAENFVRTIGPLGDLDSVWVDFEETHTTLRGRALLDRLRAFLTRVDELTGRVCGVYTGRYYWTEYVGDNVPANDIGERPLWHAEYPAISGGARDYTGRASRLTVPHPASPWRASGPVVWQWDGDGGAVLPDGTDADFDLADLAELRAAASARSSASDDAPTRPDAPAPIRRSSQSMPAVKSGPDELLGVPDRAVWVDERVERDTDPAPPPNDGGTT